MSDPGGSGRNRSGQFAPGNRANPNGRPRRDVALAKAGRVSLREAADEVVRFCGGQLRALREVGEQRELTTVEKNWGLGLSNTIMTALNTRGQLLLAAMKLDLPDEIKDRMIDEFDAEPKAKPPLEPAPAAAETPPDAPPDEPGEEPDPESE